VTADVPIMEGREDIEGEQFCAMDEQSCSEIVPPAKVLSYRNRKSEISSLQYGR